MAEAELRRALAYPRYEPPRAPGLPPAARSAVRLSRPLLAPLLPPVSAAARMSGSLLASWWPTARTAASAARQTPVGRAAEPVLWRALRVRRAARPLLPGPGRAAPHPAEAALDRVRQVAGTLVSAGVISEAGAREVLQSLVDALALRGRLSASKLKPATCTGFRVAARGVRASPGPRQARAPAPGRFGTWRRAASSASDGPGPVRPPWWAALPPAEARIRCGPGSTCSAGPTAAACDGSRRHRG